jgi:hypothetical protein
MMTGHAKNTEEFRTGNTLEMRLIKPGLCKRPFAHTHPGRFGARKFQNRTGRKLLA